MGIRFACPNGHPLHVKAELAGKRGICPECQVRFIIPTPKGLAQAATGRVQSGQAAAKSPPQAPGSPPAAAPSSPPARSPAPAARQVPGSESAAQPPGPQPANSSGAPPAAGPPPAVRVAPPAGGGQAAASGGAPPVQPQEPRAEPPQSQPVVWYVRPPSGGQFGPAEDKLMQQWASEGRIGRDSYVWRTGWPDWRQASAVPEYFPDLAASPAPASPAPVAEGYNGPKAAESAKAAPADVTEAAARYQRRRQRAARSQLIAAIVLIVLAIVLAGILVWVVQSPPGDATTPAASEAPLTEPAADDAAAEGE